MFHAIHRVEIHALSRKKQINTEKGKHMDLYFPTCKLRVVEIQDSVADIQASSSIKVSGTGRLLNITHMCYEYTPTLFPGQLRQVDLSVTYQTADSKPVTS